MKDNKSSSRGYPSDVLSDGRPSRPVTLFDWLLMV